MRRHVYAPRNWACIFTTLLTIAALTAQLEYLCANSSTPWRSTAINLFRLEGTSTGQDRNLSVRDANTRCVFSGGAEGPVMLLPSLPAPSLPAPLPTLLATNREEDEAEGEGGERLIVAVAVVMVAEVQG